MKKRLFSTIVCVVMALVMLIPADFVNTKAEAKGTIKDYATVSEGNIDSVILCSSYDDFRDQIEMGAIPLFSVENSKFSKKFSVTFKEGGYLCFRGTGYYNSSKNYMNVYRDSSYTTKVSDNAFYAVTSNNYMPVEAGTYYFNLIDLRSFYIGFVPVSSSCEIAAREQKNKSVYIDIKDIEKKTTIKATALDGIKSANYCYTSSWMNGDYDASVKDNVATILLPEPGKYTIMVEVVFNENCHNRFVYQINTKDLLADAKKMETPISILAGTNVIIGQAKPDSTVFATVNGTDYSAKADSNRTYRLKVGKMKKKKSVKMWQVENGKTTAEGTFKVVTKY